MHCRDLVELAALVAVHGPVLIRNGRVSESALEQYWTVSKARFEAWNCALGEYLEQQQPELEQYTPDAAHVVAWRKICPVLEEILTSEVLTRVWTAVACAWDRQHTVHNADPVVRSVFGGHLEARNRALNVLVYGRGFSAQQAVDLNRLRRRSERWCDMLLGYVVCDQRVEEFAFEPQRTREFSRDLMDELNRPLSPLGWQLVMSSLRTAFKQGMTEHSPNAALNQQIGAAILACFQGELFDSRGLVRSLWLERISHAAADTEGMIAELLALD